MLNYDCLYTMINKKLYNTIEINGDNKNMQVESKKIKKYFEWH